MKQKFIKVVSTFKIYYEIICTYPFLFNYRFSQHERKTLTLFDSIMAIDLEQLYSKINTLQLQMSNSAMNLQD
jgi:hypothetical protein